MERDTIAAIATGMVPASIGIIRLSGPEALVIAGEMFNPVDGKPLQEHPPRQFVYGTLCEGLGEQPLDQCLAVWFRAPYSYTGEDVVEFHCHGSALLLRNVLASLCKRGARSAEPGEFTRRAFLHGRMDLAQAEAVATLIQALTERAHRTALKNLEGALSREVRAIREGLLRILAALEVVIDYADEDIEDTPTEELTASLLRIRARLEHLVSSYTEGRILKEGATVAIAGKPNVGKSSLLNRLAGEERAIVSPIPGTTRDYIESWVKLGGFPVRLVDTAGLRDAGDPIEELGRERARRILQSADLVLFVIDGSQEVTADDERAYQLVREYPHLVGLNKSDLGICGTPSFLREGTKCFKISAVTGDGIRDLVEGMVGRLVSGASLSSEDVILMEARHRDLAEEAVRGLDDALDALSRGLPSELVNIGVRTAVSALSRITGDEVTEDLLDRIFSNFCVGK